jgi:hypothetical protein
MTNPALTDRIMFQGHALVRAIEALGIIEPTGPFERALARLLIAAYKRRLRAIVRVVPTWVSEEIRAPVSAERPHPCLTSAQSGNMLCGRDQEEPPPLRALAEAARARGDKG